jgi:hypothetical protein
MIILSICIRMCGISQFVRISRKNYFPEPVRGGKGEKRLMEIISK